MAAAAVDGAAAIAPAPVPAVAAAFCSLPLRYCCAICVVQSRAERAALPARSVMRCFAFRSEMAATVAVAIVAAFCVCVCG